MSVLLNPGLVDQVRLTGEFDAAACMNCGVCTAICPMGLGLLPRGLFHQVLMGREDALATHTETIFSCLLCRMCEECCPAGVHITENVRTLRRHVNRTRFGLKEA